MKGGLVSGGRHADVDRIAEIARRVEAGLRERVRRAELTDRDVDVVVDALLGAIPRLDRLDDEAGPFYDSTRVQELLGITKQGVAKRRASGGVVAVRLADGRRTWVYPTWQFVGSRVDPRVVELWRTLGELDGWSKVLWLRTPSAALGGATPEAAVRDPAMRAATLAAAAARAI